jgi:membrane fusion protein, heavy metal efflux system
MNKVFLLFVFATTVITGCKNDNPKHSHGSGEHSHIDPLAYTIYSEKSELFVEFKPLVIGKTSKFAAHFTKLGENFTAITEGSVSVKLIGEKDQPSYKANTPSSPGIFRLSLKPINTGQYKLVFSIKNKDFMEEITIDNVTVYPDMKTALADQKKEIAIEEIVYLKEQAWNIEFSNIKVVKQPFAEIIKTTGQILPAKGDEVIITAKSNGIITFGNSKKLIGSSVNKGETLFAITGGGLTESNIDSEYKDAKASFEKNEADFKRAKILTEEKIMPQKEFLIVELRYKNAETKFNTIANNYSASGKKITSPIQGFIKNILVNEGEYVKIGEPIASVSQNHKLILKAEVPQKYYSKLNTISSANFKTTYDNTIYSTDSLKGKFISYGKNTNENVYYIPVHFEIDNKGKIISGSYIEVFLKTTVIRNALIIPYSALIEEQGNYFAYVQTSGEGFQKRELKLGINDGVSVQILLGIKENERVVIKGAYQIKLATMSGKMPAHGHEH